MRSRRSILRRVGALSAGSAILFAGLVVPPAATGAQTGNPYERGPAPTSSSITGNGTFNVSQAAVIGQSGFGGGTIYYPSDSSQDYGAIAISPGFLTPGSLMAGWAQRLASHGFVAMAMNTNTTGDFPDSRADQLQSALDYMLSNSTVGSRIDPERLGVMGHSMGGGGSLIAADEDSRIDAAVPLQPWSLGSRFTGMEAATMIIGAQNDAIAGVGSHSEPFYESIPNSTPKAYLELGGQGHTVGISTGNDNQAGSALAWFKRFVDNDTRYDQFLCPAPSGLGISEYRENCPYPGSDPGGGTTTTGPGGGGQCLTATNSEHRDAGRAEGFLFLTAVGSGDSLGLWFSQTSLRQTSPGAWSVVDSC